VKSNLIDITVQLKHQTDLAILVTDDGTNAIWLPKSQIECDVDLDNADVGDTIEVTLPEWLALDKGLI